MYATTIETAGNNPTRTFICTEPPQSHYADDSELVARAQAGEERAFREIVERYASKICRVSYGILRNRDDAEEVAQEVFTKVYRSIRSFGGRSSLYAWIHRIAVNACYGSLRKKRIKLVHSSDSTDNTPDLLMNSIADGHPTHDQIAMQRDLINKLLARIPEEDRWLLVSKEVEGFSLAELSDMTGMNENTIKVRLFRIRQELAAGMTRLHSRRRPIRS